MTTELRCGFLLAVVVALVACGQPLTTDANVAPAYLRISGELEDGLDVTGVHTHAVIAWAFVSSGELGGVVTEVPFEPRLFAYGLTVEAPPDPDQATAWAAVPVELDHDGLAFLFGLPLLVEWEGSTSPPLNLHPDALVDWALGRRQSLEGIVYGDGSSIAAATRDHLVIALSTDTERDLASVPEWTAGGPACRIDGLSFGLTLYRAESPGCGGWRALAPAGVRTEFQGITMGHLTPLTDLL